MSSTRLIGAIIVVAVVIAAIAFGVMSDHARAALHALHVTHGLWIICKIAAVVLSAGGLLVARIYKALRPIDSGTGAGEQRTDARPRATGG
jgi:hypothetical protein